MTTTDHLERGALPPRAPLQADLGRAGAPPVAPALPSTAGRRAAYLGMCRLAGRMTDLRRGDPVAYADLRTSMCDYRGLLSQAVGQDCDRDGFTTASP